MDPAHINETSRIRKKSLPKPNKERGMRVQDETRLQALLDQDKPTASHRRHHRPLKERATATVKK